MALFLLSLTTRDDSGFALEKDEPEKWCWKGIKSSELYSSVHARGGGISQFQKKTRIRDGWVWVNTLDGWMDG